MLLLQIEPMLQLLYLRMLAMMLRFAAPNIPGVSTGWDDSIVPQL